MPKRTSRIINESLIELFQHILAKKKRPPILIYEAPTGYGKTRTAPLIHNVLLEHGFSYGYIHVLPLRSIVKNLYDDMINHKIPGLENISPEEIGYQASGLSLGGKDPFHAKPYTVTTIDSYILNLARIGVGETNILTRHYEAGRSMIYSSTIIYDEAHLYGGDPGAPEELLYTSMKASLENILGAMCPVIVLTATLPISLGIDLYSFTNSIVSSSYDGEAIWIRYGEGVEPREYSSIVPIQDKDFDETVHRVEWTTKITSNEEEFEKKLVDDASAGKRVMVVLNKPSRAYKIYKILEEKGYKPLLIHGRLSHKDREEAEKKIEETRILVATQVVEAGINISYDVLYTDIAPPSNLVQRAGRINRWFENDEAEINIFIGGYEKVYPEEIIHRTVNILKKIVDNKEEVNWRSPYVVYNGIKGYRYILDKVYEGYSSRISCEDLIKHLLLYTMINPTRKTSYEILCRNCIEGRGLVRGSLLLSLIPIPIEEVGNMSIDEIMNNSIPASMDWVISNSRRLFGDQIPVLKYNGELLVDYINNTRDNNELRRKLCMVLFNPYSHLVIGLLVKPELYIENIGLLVK